MILVLTPLAVEAELLVQFLAETEWPRQNEKKGSLSGTVFKDPAMAVFVGGHGKAQFAVQTQYLIHHLPEVRGVLCVGAAGSLTESVKPGDLVVGDPTIEHDFHLKFVKKPPPSFAPDRLWLARALAVRAPGVTVHHGPIASGDEDVLEPERARQVFKATRALAVAWEGAGGARAAAFNRLPYLEIRAVTDSANPDAPADFKKNLATGLRNNLG